MGKSKEIKLSVVFVHYSTDDLKSEVGKFCLRQLKRTLSDSCELIVVNNGQRDRDFKEYADIYIQSDKNSLGFARNKGFNVSSGEHICFIDNDVFVEGGWWQECIKMLEWEDKLLASPVYTSLHIFTKRFMAGKLNNRLLNWRSGSPCLVMKRETFKKLGKFDEEGTHGKSTIKWREDAIKKGYKTILTKKMRGYHLGVKNYAY